MIKTDEDALICDLAETYQIYDYRQLPLTVVAVFSCGLRDHSRIKLKMRDQKKPIETILLAGIYDNLSLLWWAKTKDAQKGNNKPTPIAPTLTGQSDKPKDTAVFVSGEEFERARNNLVAQINSGGGVDGD